MAEGGILISSESADNVDMNETKRIVCDPCSEDEKLVDAFGYCLDCDDYLCEHCLNHHRIPKPSRDHSLQEISSVIPSLKKTSDKIYFTCSTHQIRIATFYSKSKYSYHCQSCAVVLKKWAEEGDLVTIDELAANIRDNEEFKSFEQTLSKTQQECKTKYRQALKRKEDADVYYENIKARFNDEIDKRKHEGLKEVVGAMKTCESAVEYLNEVEILKEVYKEDDTGLYTLMKQKLSGIKSASERIAAVSEENNVVYEKIDNMKFSSIISSLLTAKTAIESDTQTLTPNKRPGNYVGYIKVKVNHLAQHYKGGLLLLDGGRLVVSDHYLNTLTLIDANNNTILSQIDLDNTLFEMISIDTNVIYVTMPFAQKIAVVHVSSSNLSKLGEIHTSGKYYTLAKYDNALRCLLEPCTLTETKLNGKYIRTIRRNLSKMKDEHGDSLITNPVHSFLVKETGSLFVSCWMKNTILEIKHGGQSGMIINDSSLRGPRGLVMDRDGSLLVCSQEGNTVLRITITGKIEDDVLPGPLDFQPISLALDENTRKLYVAGRSENINIYQI